MVSVFLRRYDQDEIRDGEAMIGAFAIDEPSAAPPAPAAPGPEPQNLAALLADAPFTAAPFTAAASLTV